MSMKFKINELIDKLQGKGYEIIETFAEKNGETLKAITERREAGVASPLIYLERLDGLTLEQAYALCDNILTTEAPDFIKGFDFSADYIKANIMPCLCHKSKVGGLYHEHAFADIEATFFVSFDNDYIMRMKQDFFENLGIDEPLLPIAIDNIRGTTIRKDMYQLLEEMSGAPMPDCFEAPANMIVISTENGQYGASAILIEKDNLQEGTILIPSSIHEFIALPQADGDEPNIDDLLGMVISANGSVIESIDVLANNVYVIHNGNICELKEVM